MPSIHIPFPLSQLILGGARSGKSRYAEELAIQSKKQVIYIATAKVLDKEMEERVSHHKNDRPAHWNTIEEPVFLADAIKKQDAPDTIILVDCLTMWLMNLLTEDDESLIKNQQKMLFSHLDALSSDIIFVSNEVGTGIVPMGELTRKFVDEAGRLHQQLAKQVNAVTLMVAGLPQKIK